MKNIIISLKFFIVVTILTGLIYPLLITLFGYVFFNHQSNGSFIMRGGEIIGSALVGQKFDQDKYFWSRPSVVDYNPLPSGGSNFSATSKQLKNIIEERKQKLFEANPSKTAEEIPSDLLYASGSGLDPQISPAAAKFQVDRIVKARQLDSTRKSAIISLIDRLTEGRDLMILGEKRVNVLLLNAALDDLR